MASQLLLLGSLSIWSLGIMSHPSANNLSRAAQELRPDLPLESFGNSGLVEWTAQGTAFNAGPISGAGLTALGIDNDGGSAVVTTKVEGDTPTGSLTSRTFKIQRKYISFRIAGGDHEYATCLSLSINGKIVKTATGRNSDHLTATSWDVSEFQGKPAKLEILDSASGDWGHISVARILQTDQPEQLPISKGKLYHEELRPQFHFTARQWAMDRLEPREKQEGWVNDLNGLIYYDGEYHLFAQRWAKCWIHAVSKDLIHWKELEPAFWEEAVDSGVQSGTCIVDYHNTSGLGKDPAHPPMLAFWSRFDNQTQCFCYSLDHGRSWARYAKNPVMINPERDPKVFWYAPGNHWVMMMYGEGSYHILTSPNLLDWKDEHHPIKDSFECPDFFELPLDGDQSKKKWVLIQGNGNYSVGTFNGTEFTEETQRFPCDIGPHFYATQSWANTDTGDGKRIQAAWMRGAFFPGMPFNQELSFPCELTLHSTPDGPRVYRQPIKQIALLHEKPAVWKDVRLESNSSVQLATKGDTFHIKASLDIPEGTELTLHIRGVELKLTRNTLDTGHGRSKLGSSIHSFELLVDRASIEIFLNDGQVSSTNYALLKGEGIQISTSGPAALQSLTVYPLKSAWK